MITEVDIIIARNVCFYLKVCTRCIGDRNNACSCIDCWGYFHIKSHCNTDYSMQYVSAFKIYWWSLVISVSVTNCLCDVRLLSQFVSSKHITYCNYVKSMSCSLVISFVKFSKVQWTIFVPPALVQFTLRKTLASTLKSLCRALLLPPLIDWLVPNILSK